MKIGYCGLGKLGFPVALATVCKGHQVFGYDPYVKAKTYLAEGTIPYLEKGVPELIKEYMSDEDLEFADVENPFDLVTKSEIIFVPVQTPHDPRFEGKEPMPENERADFDYSYLIAAVSDLAKAALWQKKEIILVVISTVLPGTMEREIKPLLNDYVKLCYNPYFIAMGTTVDDYLHPEFVLLGCDEDEDTYQKVQEFYTTIHDRPVFVTNVASAELIKVSYNTYISMKIGFANTIMEICQKTDADVDQVAEALSMATERIISPKYLKGGMGDGGGCHPRDNIAMSWLAEELDLSYNIFESLMIGREDQAQWLSELTATKAGENTDWRPVVLLGKAYKPETNLTIGSPAYLVEHFLRYDHAIIAEMYDPFVDEGPTNAIPEHLRSPDNVYVITTNHPTWAEVSFPQGSCVIDPWGYIPDQQGVEVIRVGRKGKLAR